MAGLRLSLSEEILMYEATSTCIHNLQFPLDDYGNIVMQTIQYTAWTYSTCTYGGFGVGWNDFCQDI